MAIAAVQILRVNTRFLPKAIRPPLWRQIGLVLCAIAYGAMTIALLYDSYQKYTVPKAAVTAPAEQPAK